MMTLTLLNLQVTLLTYMGIGVVLSKTGMIRDGDQRFLSELVLNVLLPISVFVSFVENISFSLLKSLAGVLFAAILLETLIYLFTKLPLQKDLTPGQRSVVRYSLSLIHILIYQNEFGCEHLIGDPAGMLEYLKREIAENAQRKVERRWDEIGSGLVRLHLAGLKEQDAEAIFDAMRQTAAQHLGSEDSFQLKLKEMRRLCQEDKLPFDEQTLDAWLEMCIRDSSEAGWTHGYRNLLLVRCAAALRCDHAGRRPHAALSDRIAGRSCLAKSGEALF